MYKLLFAHHLEVKISGAVCLMKLFLCAVTSASKGLVRGIAEDCGMCLLVSPVMTALHCRGHWILTTVDDHVYLKLAR